MKKDYTEVDVQAAIRGGLESFVLLAKDELRKKWKRMGRTEKYAAGRALVYMNDVASNPSVYFSRWGTQDAWVKRAEQYAQEKQLEEKVHAFYIVESPQVIVATKAQPALSAKLYSEYFMFCTNIQQWEYDRTSPNKNNRYLAPVSAGFLVENAKGLQSAANLTIKHPVVRYVQKKWRMLTK